jgi:hypothetical protein
MTLNEIITPIQWIGATALVVLIIQLVIVYIINKL